MSDDADGGESSVEAPDCSLCGSRAPDGYGNLYSDSGASLAALCEECRRRLSFDRCRMCGDETEPGAAGEGSRWGISYPHAAWGGEGETFPLCKRCYGEVEVAE